jgi:hypothetical protein
MQRPRRGIGQLCSRKQGQNAIAQFSASASLAVVHRPAHRIIESVDDVNLDLLRRTLRAEGYSADQRFHGGEPFVGLVDRVGGTIVGRFFPSRNAILVVRDDDPMVTRARLNHEFAHYLQYQHRCGGSSATSCGYRGGHDAGFYRTLEAIHRQSGVPTETAVFIEERARYGYPKAWNRPAW